MMKNVATILAILAALVLAAPLHAGAPPPTPPPAAAPTAAADGLGISLTTASPDAKAQLVKGLLAADAFHNDDARAAFAAALKADPGFALAHFAASWVSQSTEQRAAALKAAGDAAAKASPAERAWIEVAQKSFAGDGQGELLAAKRFTELAKDSPRAWIQLGDSSFGNGKHAEARAAYEKAVALAPAFAPAHAALGNSYLFSLPRDFAKGEAAMKKVVELLPKQAQSHDFLGDAYRAQNKLKEARDAYSKAAELEPKSAVLYQQRGHTQSFLGDFAAARADYDKAVSLAQTAEEKLDWGMFRAVVSIHEGKAQAAIDELRQLAASVDKTAGAKDPAENKAWLQSVVVTVAAHAGALKDAKAALAELDTLTKALIAKTASADIKREWQATAVGARGFIAACEGDAKGAKAAADELLKLRAAETNPLKDSFAHEILGRAALQQKKYADAVAELKQSDTVNGIYARYELALAYEGAGNVAEAQKLFAEIAVYNFNAPEYALVRAAAAQKAGAQKKT